MASSDNEGVLNWKIWLSTLMLLAALGCGGSELTNSEVTDIYAVCATFDDVDAKGCNAMATALIDGNESGGLCDFKTIMRAIHEVPSRAFRQICPIPGPNFVHKYWEPGVVVIFLIVFAAAIWVFLYKQAFPRPPPYSADSYYEPDDNSDL